MLTVLSGRQQPDGSSLTQGRALSPSTLPPDHPAVRIANRLTDQWSRHTTVTLLTTFNMVMSSPSPRWFDENVASSRYVLGSSVIRTPDVRTGP